MKLLTKTTQMTSNTRFISQFNPMNVFILSKNKTNNKIIFAIEINILFN